jgi:MFS family permease
LNQRSVQAHIEGSPLSSMQWLVWALATAGKFFEGLIVFMGGIALPLVSEQFQLTALDRGLVTAAPLVGILIGALGLGGLADRLGRRPVFIAEMLLLVVGLVAAALSPNGACFAASLGVVGLALGADYPAAHLVISESIPVAMRGRLVLGAFSCQALGAVLGTALAAQLLGLRPELGTWRLFYLLPVWPVLLVALGRLFLPESSPWLLSRGDLQGAERQLARLLNRSELSLEPAAPMPPPEPEAPWRQLFQPRLRRATTLSAVPWFLQDVSTYGIGLFTPLIMAAAFGLGSPDASEAALIHNDLLAARGTALINLAFLVGIGVAMGLADRWGRIPLQILGFAGCAAGLLLAAAGASPSHQQLPLIVAGFVLFQFMTNLGPNAQTYLLAGEVFPTPLRGFGAGLAAAAGKLGAVLAAFGFPLFLAHWGLHRLLPLLALCSLLGAAVTWYCRIETKGLDLNSLHPAPPTG